MVKEEYKLNQVTMRSAGSGRQKVAEKPHDFKKAWGMIFRYCGNYRAAICGIAVLAVLWVLFSLFGPDRLNRITNMITDGIAGSGIDTAAILRMSVQVLILYVLSSVLSYLQNFMTVYVSQGVSRRMRTDISHKLNRIPLSRLDSSSFGDLLSRVTNDVDTISESLSGSAAQMVNGVVTFLGCSVAMLLSSRALTAVAIASSLLGLWAMNVLIRRSQKYFVRRQRYLGELNGHIEEIYAAHTIVMAYNGEKEAADRFEELNEQLYTNNWMSQFVSGVMTPLMDFVGNLGYLSVCVAGAILVTGGWIRFGTVVAFIVYVKMFTQPLGQVAQAVTNLQSAAAAAERVFVFLDEPEMEKEDGKRRDFQASQGEVQFDQVTFGYVPEKTVIHHFSFTAKPRQKVAIVGPTGAGKTTIVNLLMRFYECSSGCIRIDGVDIRDMTRENVRELFGMILQDTWLFEGTIRDNICYGNPEATDEEVERACRMVGLHRYICSLKDGYQTRMTNTFSLSAGQRQLMTIARAMVSNKPLLILDEATSSVDTRTEQIVQDAMEQLTAGRTSFTIAHRLSTIRNADVILVMKDGDIVEQGSHQELLDRQGFYYELWNSQFVKAETI